MRVSVSPTTEARPGIWPRLDRQLTNTRLLGFPWPYHLHARLIMLLWLHAACIPWHRSRRNDIDGTLEPYLVGPDNRRARLTRRPDPRGPVVCGRNRGPRRSERLEEMTLNERHDTDGSENRTLVMLLGVRPDDTKGWKPTKKKCVTHRRQPSGINQARLEGLSRPPQFANTDSYHRARRRRK